MNVNLDRFAVPLESERVRPYYLAEMIQEQQELNKKAIVDDYISTFYSEYGLVPETETIQEIFYKLDLDEDMINERRKCF